MINCIIVDDEQHCIDIMMYYVNQTEGLNVIGFAKNGTTALELINNSDVDLLFQDVQMPDISGIDIVKSINGKCDVIFTTGYSKQDIDYLKLGVADLLSKPISYARFTKAVQQVIEKRKDS